MAGEDVNKVYRIPDSLCERIEPLLPPELPGLNGDPPQTNHREAMEAILYVLQTNCDWKDIPHSLGIPHTVHERFKEWRKAGVFQRMWRSGLLKYDEFRTLFWHDKPWMQSRKRGVRDCESLESGMILYRF